MVDYLSWSENQRDLTLRLSLPTYFYLLQRVLLRMAIYLLSDERIQFFDYLAVISQSFRFYMKLQYEAIYSSFQRLSLSSSNFKYSDCSQAYPSFLSKRMLFYRAFESCFQVRPILVSKFFCSSISMALWTDPIDFLLLVRSCCCLRIDYLICLQFLKSLSLSQCSSSASWPADDKSEESSG